MRARRRLLHGGTRFSPVRVAAIRCAEWLGWLPTGAAAFGGLILLAALGKAIGMTAAEVRLRRNSRQLRRMLDAPVQ